MQARKYAPWLLALMALASRLPQLCSDLLLLDGDECIVGLMAKHLYEGRELPLYFYGQSYGFSFIELLCIDLFYLVGGISDLPVKLAMLSLWTVGLLIFYRVLKAGSEPGSWLPLLVCLLFIFSPAWAVWSMKARGGYLTAFLLSPLALYLALGRHRSWPAWLLVGLLLPVIYESQPLWLPGLMPLLAYGFYRQRTWRSALALLAGLAGMGLLFHFLKKDLSHFWSPYVITLHNDLPAKLPEIPLQVYHSLTGSYDYFTMIETGWATNALAAAYTVLTFLGPLAGLYFLGRKKPYWRLYAACLSVVLSLSYLVLLAEYSPRYLLPLTGFLLFMLHELLIVVKSKLLQVSLFAPLLALGLLSLIGFKDYRFEQQTGRQLRQAMDLLASKHVHHVFCRHGLLQWQVSFYSKERVIARYVTGTDRYPAYIEQVNRAYESGAPTAMFDFFYHIPFEASEEKFHLDLTYMVHIEPSRKELKEYGFEIDN